MASGAAIAAGAGVALFGLGIALTLAEKNAQAAQPAGPTKCPVGPITGGAPQTYNVHFPQTGTSMTIGTADTLQSVLDVRPGYDWTVTSSDESILAKAGSSIAPDPSSPFGDNARIDVWRSTGYGGKVTLTGQLLPTGGGAPVSRWSLTVNVACG